MNKRMKLIFTVSLLVNILFVAAGLGMLYKFCRDVPIPPDMSPDGRHYVAMTFQNGRKDAEPLIQDVKAKRKALEEVLIADEFDEAAYEKAVDAFLDTKSDIQRHRAATMQKALEKLSGEDRKKFARNIIEGLDGGRPRKKGMHHKPPKDGIPPPAEEAGKP
ncbi:MAG: hypothetical protein DI551_07400 [Micavibrio aeruginosavorus]|uniref:Periplasmic heavy metal sensor n=1 Tax=Micavibrio aeruginosavorus TaxID=349221 RepID=A0A2W5MW46_9BACT|nr:MAG: hypothetical protein DI551_07400 [Micavibrio aeruginosavorus]